MASTVAIAHCVETLWSRTAGNAKYLHSLEPRLPEMRRALADARGWLGYGDADRGPAYNSTAGAAAQLLLHAAALRLP